MPRYPREYPLETHPHGRSEGEDDPPRRCVARSVESVHVERDRDAEEEEEEEEEEDASTTDRRASDAAAARRRAVAACAFAAGARDSRARRRTRHIAREV